ncbi:hypothetical protein J1N35_030733 [Gossypium stocksii]|uniref:DUF4283 domain-containing protein n=1 Tax=Gossypium stocksii TaxID=47602 RepID=A0A9D3V091_9ROSI|nr:hypothetical protein J1N35_030733 [Gossypium stocksii]
MRTLAYLRHPLGGVSITNIGEKRYLFWFYYAIDIKRVMESMSWSFKMHLIIFHRLGQGEDSLQVPLVYTKFWVQVYNLPIGVVLEGLARHGEGFCPLRMTIGVHEVEFGWDASLRAPSRREAMMSRKWLQENCSGINQAGGNSFDMDVDERGEGKSFSDIQIVNPYLNSWSRDGVMTR